MKGKVDEFWRDETSKKASMTLKIWRHPDFEQLEPNGKLVMLFLLTSGRYSQIGFSRIAFETGLSVDEVDRQMEVITKNPELSVRI